MPAPRRAAASAGFTLLEVLVAVAILGLGLTIVSSAQTGVFWSYARATRLSQAPGLARCKMSELELKLLKDGFSLLDEKDEGECCEDADVSEYTCDWAIETVVLPDMPLDDALGGDAGAPGGLGGGTLVENGEGEGAGAGPVSGAGPLGALAQLQQSGGSALGSGAGIGDLTEMMGGGLGAGGGIAGMVMGLVYPDLKPLLEASIRKLTVTVHWKEGQFERDLAVVQYVTSPQQGGFDPAAAEGLAEAAGTSGGAGILDGLLPGGGSGLSIPGLKP